MHAVITDISQGLSLETGASYSFMTLMLPNGQLIRASVDDQALEAVTKLFMSSGSPAANTAAQSVQSSKQGDSSTSQPAPRAAQPAEPAQLERSFSPLIMQEEVEGETVSTFGGNFEGTELEGVGEALRQAEEQMARAVGDTSSFSGHELRAVVDAIAKTPPAMPVPNVMQQAKPRLHVEADARGNPIIKGAGLVDPRMLTGGNTEGEEDAGQI